MATKKGKGTTPKSVFISLAREVNRGDRAALVAWHRAFVVFVASGCESKSAFADAWCKAVKGTVEDTHTAGTVRVNLSHIAWAEENIIGGALACKSMQHIIASKKPAKKSAVQAKAHKVSTVTITDAEFAKALRKAGLSAEVIALATKVVFITK